MGHSHYERNSEANRCLRSNAFARIRFGLTPCFYCSLRYSLVVCSQPYMHVTRTLKNFQEALFTRAQVRFHRKSVSYGKRKS